MKKVVRTFTLMMVIGILTLSLAACGQAADKNANTESSQGITAEPTPADTGKEAFVVGFANNNDLYDYCAKFRDYLVEESKSQGIEIIVTDAKGDTNVQNGQIDDFLVQDAKIISAISNDLDGSVPALEAAKNAKVPYISFLTTIRGANEYPGFIYIGSQNYDAGVMQGEYLVDALPENAKIIYFTGQPNDQQYTDRKAGLMDTLLAQRKDVQILAEYNVENKKDLGMSTTEDCLQAFTEFDAIVCQNDDAALGVVEALKAAKRLDGVITVGLDGSNSALTSIEEGELSMSVLQNAKAQAKAGAEVFAKIRDGVDPATIEDIMVPFEIITKENVTNFK